MNLKRQPYRAAKKTNPSILTTLRLVERRGAKLLSWLVGITQIVLLGVAVYTYKYTLVPLYKQAILEDSLAKTQLALKEAEERKKTVETEMISSNKNLLKARELAESSARALRDSERSARELNDKAAVAKGEAAVAKQQAQSAAELARAADRERQNAYQQRDLAYGQVRKSVLKAVSIDIHTCISKPTSLQFSEERCFERQGGGQEQTLYELLTREDAQFLDQARKRAGAAFPKAASDLRSRVLLRVESTDAEYRNYKSDGSVADQEKKWELRNKAEFARDRRAELPIISIPRLADRLIEEHLPVAWTAR